VLLVPEVEDADGAVGRDGGEDPGLPQAMSCAMSSVSTTPRSMSQTVQVVSMEAVPIRRGSISFQSKEVRGAQNSEAALRLSRTERSSGAEAVAERSSSGACQMRSVSAEEARRDGAAARGLNWSLVGG
jgi:hypothetical protein